MICKLIKVSIRGNTEFVIPDDIVRVMIQRKNKTLEIDYKIKVLFEYDDIKKFLDFI